MVDSLWGRREGATPFLGIRRVNDFPLPGESRKVSLSDALQNLSQMPDFRNLTCS